LAHLACGIGFRRNEQRSNSSENNLAHHGAPVP
jgi:hypothetical protein